MSFKTLKELTIECLPIVWLPTLLQALYNMSSNWLTTERFRFLFFILPDWHTATLVVIIVVGNIAYIMLKKQNLFVRIYTAGVLVAIGIIFYEMIWLSANAAFRAHQLLNLIPLWTIETPLEASISLMFYGLLMCLFFIQRASKSLHLNIRFFAVQFAFMFLFALQVLYDYDWAPEAIPLNNPILWLMTKIVGYGSWLLLIKVKK